jgi:hypothetical protein
MSHMQTQAKASSELLIA